MKKFLTYGLVVVLIIGIAGYFLFKDGNGKYKTIVVHPADFIRQVSVSGKVTAVENLDLSFEQSGRVKSVLVSVGDEVFAGQVLAEQESLQLESQLAEAQAGVDAQKAKLAQLLDGTSPEDIVVAETTVSNAKTALSSTYLSLNDTKQSLIDKIKDAYTKADDAILNKTDQIFNNPQSGNPQIIFTADSSLHLEINWERLLIGVVLKNGNSIEIAKNDDLFALTQETKNNLNKIKSFLEKVSMAVNNPNNCYVSENSCRPIPVAWKTDNSIARSNINTAISNLSSAEEKLRTEQSGVKTAEGNLEIAKNQLSVKKAPARAPDVSLNMAQIKQAEAGVQNILAQIGKRKILSPIVGVVSIVNSKVGSIAVSNETAVSVISADTLQVESFVPEKNIPFIKIGDIADISLDAYGEAVIFDAKVISIDPAETVRDGVSTYKIKFSFLEKDARVKPGMTANIIITTAQKTGVIAVPQGIVANKNGKNFVKIKEGDIVSEKEVEIGSVSSLGQLEIISGLKDGDIVILEKPVK